MEINTAKVIDLAAEKVADEVLSDGRVFERAHEDVTARIDKIFAERVEVQISAIVDALDSKPRIVQCIQACNEEQLIEACLLQLYDKVDKIRGLNIVIATSAKTDDEGRSLLKTMGMPFRK